MRFEQGSDCGAEFAYVVGALFGGRAEGEVRNDELVESEVGIPPELLDELVDGSD